MEAPAARTRHRAGPVLVALALALLVGLGAWTRVRVTEADPNFAASPPQGLLRSDPALLYYFVERILESGGVPADFRADGHLEHPERVDVPALFPVGPEFLIAGLYRLFGDGIPLHLFCLYVSSLCASTLVIGVYLLARELSGRRGLALAAALFATLLPANYRTLGFLLVGEDYSLPLFALHLGLAARAARDPTPLRVLAAACALLLSLACWHAASFFFAIEAAAVFVWFWRSGRNPCALPATAYGVGLLILGGLAVPVLRHTGFALSLPMQLVGGLCIAALVARRGGSTPAQRGAALLGAAALLAASLAFARLGSSGAGEYSHVFGLMWHKLVHLGQLPSDPEVLPFEVRLMWQGPFATLAPSEAVRWLGLGCAGLVWGCGWLFRGSVRSRGEDLLAITCVTLLLALPLAWLVERTLVLPALLAAPLAVAGIARLRWKRAVCAGGIAAQAWLFAGHAQGYVIPWYQPLVRQQELAQLVQELPRLVPEGEAIAADFVNGTALLARTRHPILFQPKWESRQSRERIEEFLRAFFHGSTSELNRLLRGHFQCRYLLVDRAQLVQGCSYQAGIRPGSPPEPGSPAGALASADARELDSIPGYRLVYRSPNTLLQSNGRPSDLYRLFELLPLDK